VQDPTSGKTPSSIPPAPPALFSGGESKNETKPSSVPPPPPLGGVPPPPPLGGVPAPPPLGK